jgi:hypothetical protein
MNVQVRIHILRTFITHLLVHMHQKKKIALEIAAKIASVNGSIHKYTCALPLLLRDTLQNIHFHD